MNRVKNAIETLILELRDRNLLSQSDVQFFDKELIKRIKVQEKLETKIEMPKVEKIKFTGVEE